MVEAVEPARLVAGARALGVELGAVQATRLVGFARLLARFNGASNLISRRDEGRLLPRHLLDSLSVAPLLGDGAVLDLGTGAGLPGIPLAIARDSVQFTLADRSERRIRFVERVVRQLGLDNVTTWCGDVRDLPAATFETVVCRAVADAAGCWSLAAPRLSPGGQLVILHRSRSRPMQAVAVPGKGAGPASAALPAGVRLESRREVSIPGLDQNHEILVLRR